MRVLVQRVLEAHVEVENKIVGKIRNGLLAFVGFKKDDGVEQLIKASKKLISLRIFSDEQGKMNKAVQDIDGEILLISQFTLYSDTSRGNRPGFEAAMPAEEAEKLFQQFVLMVKGLFPKVQTGIFQADMKVKLINDGPVTIMLEF
jgi:D-tyrosyl-tRNA(Tyr) deacylase